MMNLIFIDVKNEMIACLDEHIEEKNKIRPENIYKCIKILKLMNLKNHCFFIKLQIMISKNK